MTIELRFTLGFLGILLLTNSAPGIAQTKVNKFDSDQAQPTVNNAGRVSESAVGEVGQRIVRNNAAERLAPTARIASRVQSRLATRIKSRIDRNYDPEAGVTVPSVTTYRPKPLP
jgi:hypothetical protein